MASFWDLIIWKYFIHEFTPILIVLLIVSYFNFKNMLYILIRFLTATLILLLVYEVGYMINDLLAKYEPIRIKTERILTLGIKYDLYIFLIFSKAAFTLMLVLIFLNESFVFTVSLWILFCLHSAVHSNILRGIATAPLLKVLCISFLLSINNVDLYQAFVISYGLAQGFAESYTYLSAKRLLTTNISRLYELISISLLTVTAYYIITIFVMSKDMITQISYHSVALSLPFYYFMIYSLKGLFKRFLRLKARHEHI
ncbi:MAG: hypothetical protein QXM43_04700 [Desulfurococcaceae archaeon]